MRNTTTTVVIAAGAVLAAVIVTRTPAGDPCPTPKMIEAISFQSAWIARLWSSGQVEVRLTIQAHCWDCEEARPQPYTWADFGVPQLPTADAKPVNIAPGGPGNLVVGYSDGTVYWTTTIIEGSKPCTGEGSSIAHCELLPPVWELLP